MIHPGRYTTKVDGDFVVFMIGMRFNKPWKVRQWFPVFVAMPKMLRWLDERPEAGLLGWRQYIGAGGPMTVQYWRSFEHLDRFARQADAPHMPAWKAFNQIVRGSGDVGIWHETYQVHAGEYEAIYGNMPRIGLGTIGEWTAVGSTGQSAARRIGATEADEPALEPYANPA